jgi:predicted acylesterase/phospholipase RssA
VLGGGGITGALYELGCLAALEDHVPGFVATDFELYVGTSAGATVAACLAGAVPARRMYRALLDPHDDFFPLERKHFFRFDTTEWRRVVASAVGAVRRATMHMVTEPQAFDLWQELDRFYDSLPAGVFDLGAYETFLAGFFARRGIADRFADLPRRLLVPAADLDEGARVVFGVGRYAHVPVSRAVCASSALPVLFAPVQVGARDYVDAGAGRAAHADLALRWGADFILIINPVVPVRNDPSAVAVPTGHGPRSRVRDKGLLWVYEQALRTGLHARLGAEVANLRAAVPHAIFGLLEPDLHDATLFMHSPMNFGARRTILRHGYDTAVAWLRTEAEPLRARFTMGV